jgi:hypothetical protein
LEYLLGEGEKKEKETGLRIDYVVVLEVNDINTK